jgi:hypothetical protein
MGNAEGGNKSTPEVNDRSNMARAAAAEAGIVLCVVLTL